MNWNEFLTPYQAEAGELFSKTFLERWGKEKWAPSPNDRTAAAMLHTQIISRITTQQLAYLDGVERTALDSVYALFKATRDLNDRFPDARHFHAVAWEVLNIQVRPFTAKWHRESERGVLVALDATDEFRDQLTQLQRALRVFDNLLIKLSDENAPSPVPEGPNEREDRIAGEMASPVKFGIPIKYGGIDAGQAKDMNDCEKEAIAARRSHYQVRLDADGTGLALSGGGIRSATFSLGVLVALARRGLLPQIDYLSTVSGGGYIGSFLSAFLSSPKNGEIGLRSWQLPFRREVGEALALRHIRHHCKYLATGSTWQQAGMICAQLYGMALNGLAIAIFVAVAVTAELLLPKLLRPGTLELLTTLAIVLLIACALFSLLTLRLLRSWQKYADRLLALSLAIWIAMLCSNELGPAHSWYRDVAFPQLDRWGATKVLSFLAVIPAALSTLAVLFGRSRKYVINVLMVLTGIAAPLFLLGFYFALYEFASRTLASGGDNTILWIAVAASALGYLLLFDINSTSPHRHYRDRLAEAFLIQPRKKLEDAKCQDTKSEVSGFDTGVSIRLSKLNGENRGPYHLINCALNVPGSKNIALQGRLTDFFLFSPCFSGSSLTGYYPTSEWEAGDGHLDLGTAMAISAAAASPQMGLATRKTLRFWLALLNIRLGYWAKKPGSKLRFLTGSPGISCLGREMLGTMNENSHWLNLTDGGHIENLGVYELLRRRCKYIIAIDGEEDANMTFHALTTLQRLAAIDFKIRIDINLDDLRLNDQKLSRSHFRFCRIRYPKEGNGAEDEIGYLLYVKLSLTGNEGEFIRRYRMDNPAFPHDPTANQFFSETQFEAYRTLGEHVGDKLFLRAIVGDLAAAEAVSLQQWFLRLGKGLLDPLPKVVQRAEVSRSSG